MLKIQNKKKFLFFMMMTIMLLALQVQTISAQFNHPGVQFSTEDLERMKNNINVEPWKTGYELMLEEESSSINYEMQGPFEVVSRNGENNDAYDNDMDAVFFQSIQWYITGDDRFAENAMEIIEAWSSAHKTLNGNVPSISVTDRGVKMMTGAEILRYNYSGWTNSLTQISEEYAREVLLPPLYLPDATRVANQGAGQINGALALAVYINDEQLFDDVIDAFLNESCAGITNSLPNGQNGDSGRDYGHAFGMVINLAGAAEQAHKQGVDLFSVLDNRILAMTEYWNAYGLDVDVDFTPYGTCYDYFETIGSNGRGSSDFNTNMLLEIVNGAYSVRKGISNPFTTQRINEIPVSWNTFLFKKDVDATNSTSPGAPHAEHSGVTDNQLTNITIGNDNSTGSSSFNQNDNTWTIVGNGDVYGFNDSDACQFAYKQMDSNATIITKVSNINSSNSNAKVGLMFRESLDSDSDMFALYAYNGGGVEATWRGQTITYSLDRDADGANLNSFDDVDNSGWIKIVVNESRVAGFYSTDNVVWVPVSSANFDQTEQYQLGLFSGSNGSVTATGTFTNIAVLTAESTEISSFIPDPEKTYYIDSPHHNVRLAATGESEDAYTTDLTTTGSDVEWKFVAKGNGSWHIQKAVGGSKPRLRTRNNGGEADMQETSSSGTWTYWDITNGSSSGNYFLTLPDGPGDLDRLQIDSGGNINMVPTSFNGSWESFNITEASSVNSSIIVHITKRNATGFAIDGGNGGSNRQDVTLSSANTLDEGQLWVEIDRGDGYYSYEKYGTNYSLDGDGGGANNQSVYLWETDDTNQNQQWQKVAVGDGGYKLIKRNATGFAINGGTGGLEGRDVNLYDSGNSSQNLQWYITPISTSSQSNKDVEITNVLSDIVIYPNPVISTTTIKNAANSKIVVYDMNGSIVFTQIISSEEEVIDLSILVTGIYYTEVNGGETLSIVKIVKN